MYYESTRNNKLKKKFSEVLLEGLADDGGLYVPKKWPKVSKGNFNNLIKWLRYNVHAKGSLTNSEELIKNITGEELNIEYFKKHLINRYLN